MPVADVPDVQAPCRIARGERLRPPLPARPAARGERNVSTSSRAGEVPHVQHAVLRRSSRAVPSSMNASPVTARRGSTGCRSGTGSRRPRPQAIVRAGDRDVRHGSGRFEGTRRRRRSRSITDPSAWPDDERVAVAASERRRSAPARSHSAWREARSSRPARRWPRRRERGDASGVGLAATVSPARRSAYATAAPGCACRRRSRPRPRTSTPGRCPEP